MKTITKMISDEVFEASNENGNKVIVDTRKVEERENQSPMELVLSALAGCAAVDIVLMLKKRKKQVRDLLIETTGTRNEETPRFFTSIHCHYIFTSPDATEDEIQKVVQLALGKYCSVASSLKSKITFTIAVQR